MAGPAGIDDGGPSGPGGSAIDSIPDVFGDDGGRNIVDPAAVSSPGGDGDDRPHRRTRSDKGRSRTGGGSATAKKAISSLDLSAFSGLLVGFHSILETNIGPEWQMSEPEANGIAKASANVLRHYNIEATQKAIDYAALAAILSQSYGIRLAATVMRNRAAASARPRPVPAAGPVIQPGPPVDLNRRDPFSDPLVH